MLIKNMLKRMESCDIQEMLKSHYDDPCFIVNGYNLGRALLGAIVTDSKTPHISNTKSLKCWRIVGDILVPISNNKDMGIFFSGECYLIQWTFEFVVANKVIEETLFYYWKGSDASKGFSPLPPEIENQNVIVDRISQWSEPALFFHMFSNNVIVFNGKEENFQANDKHLFIIRGELQSEIHLYEIPYSERNFRNRSIFLLVEPDMNRISYLYGAATSQEYQQLIQNTIKPNDFEESWKDFDIEQKRCVDCQGLLEGNDVKFQRTITPRLFYFNLITGSFLATEVEYNLRSKEHIAAFPFLQSHLYTADQPALFLLDNGYEVWLWEGLKIEGTDFELFDLEMKIAQKTAVNYAQEKEKLTGRTILPIKQVKAGVESEEFTNLFPYWKYGIHLQ